MDDESFRRDLSDLKRLRARLEAITNTKTVSKEAITEASDSKADDEASAIATGAYADIEKARKHAEARSIVEKNLDSKVNRKLRWKYASWVFCYLVAYSIFVGVVLIAAGWGLLCFSLPSSVLEFLVGSTAAAAIGLVYAVTHGLFVKN